MLKSELHRIIKEEINKVLVEAKSALVETILNKLKTDIDKMVSTIEAVYKKQGMKFTEFDREYARLNVVFDMLTSIEKYTLPTDKLVSISSGVARNGSMEISSTINRDGNDYYLETDAILAGGYNIQRLHYRYITKTSLPKTNNNNVTSEYRDKIKKMSKAENYNNQIKTWEARIKKNTEHIEWASKFSDEEILQRYYEGENSMRHKIQPHPSWEEIVKRDAAKNYNNDKDYYYSEMKKYEQNSIDFWKKQNIEWKQQDNSNGEKEIDKLNKKLSSLL